MLGRMHTAPIQAPVLGQDHYHYAGSSANLAMRAAIRSRNLYAGPNAHAVDSDRYSGMAHYPGPSAQAAN
jgi:hypothetical protein